MPQSGDNVFPVPRVPPASWFYPRLDQKRRHQAMRLNTIAKGIIRDSPHLGAARHRVSVKIAAIRLFLLEKALNALPDNPLNDGGEIRESYSTVARLADHAQKALAALDISVTGPQTEKDNEAFAAIFTRVARIYEIRHGTKEIEDGTN